MAYVCERPPTRRIVLPRRRWNRGMGQMSLSAEFCAALGLTTGWCAQYNAPPAPALPAPSAPQTYYDMTSGTYTPDQSELDTETAAVTGAQTFLQNVATPGVVPACDWTQATWTDPTTYCAGNWLIVGLVVVVGVAAIAGKGKFY